MIISIHGIFSAVANFATRFFARVLADGGTVEAQSCVQSASPLLQKASYLFIPSGYKASKAYAVLPENGNGDMTWTRNSEALRLNSSGVYESLAINVPRYTYDFGSCPAALLEPQRTNSIRNNTMVGASTFPSTLPNNWSIAATGGLSSSIIALGTENGLSYIDVRINGTATGVSYILQYDANTAISASNGQAWTSSLFAKVISQSLPPSAYRIFLSERDSSGLNLASSTSVFIPTTSTVYIVTAFNAVLTIGNSYDFTIRIATPQMELGAFATSPILTSGATATRIFDRFTLNNIYTNGLISPSGGTWYVELKNNVALISDNINGIWIGTSSTNQTVNGTIILRQGGGTQRTGIFIYSGGVSTFLYYPTTDNSKIAIKWNGSTLDIFNNGVKVVTGQSFSTTIMENLATNFMGRTFLVQSMALFNAPLEDIDTEILTSQGYSSYSEMATALGYSLL